MAQLVKSLPTTWETWVRSLGSEDAQEKGKATHSSIPWTEWATVYGVTDQVISYLSLHMKHKHV